jgi:non-ribosomal peptide synthetase component F
VPVRCVHELFEAQADRTPDALAVRCGHTQLTYGELDHRANGFARRLIELGVGPEVLVGVCLDRSLELVIALLGVLKAGGGYLPLDPAYPQERLRFMLSDSNAGVVVTKNGLAPPSSATVIALDDDRELIQRSHIRPAGGACPSNAAYVIYTSGSTGRPKGVVLEHAALCRYAAVAKPITPGSRRLFSAAIGFSASVRHLLLPLVYGRTVIVASEEDRSDVRRTLALLGSEGIGVWDTTPSLLDTALSLAESHETVLEPLETILVTGEPLLPSTAKRLNDLTDGRVQLVNLYSQTETVGTVTSHIAGPAEGLIIPAGRPLADVRVDILGADLQPVEEGDVWIRSRRLARGYRGAHRACVPWRPGP